MLSVVVPVYNEEESLEKFYEELLRVLPDLSKKYEIIFIDDGSTDNSLSILKSLAKKNEHVRIFSFRQNLGKSEALTLGFMKAKGEYIVTLDADLQDKPTEIQKLLVRAENGTDVVCGWRKDRKDSQNAVLSSKLFNAFAGMFWGLQLHDYNCGLKVYRKDAARSLYLYSGMHRFIPLLAYQQGFTVEEVAVDHAERKFGESKYARGIIKIFQNLPDMFTMLFLAKYSKRPMHFFGVIGGTLFVVGFVIFSYLCIIWFMGESIGTRPLLTLSILLILSGLQTFLTGFLADLIINISHKEGNINSFPLKYTSDTQ
ncbi:MAG: glycosyltransferase family 2 protein [Patescibacteria group bacterium]